MGGDFDADREAFVDALAEQMEANAELHAAVGELRGDISAGEIDGLQSRLSSTNEFLKDFARTLPFDIAEEHRAQNWDDVLTMRDAP
jgi:hypothetical protein